MTGPAGSPARRRRGGWRAVSGTGGAATAVLAVLVCGCVFGSLAGARVSLAMRTQALRQQLAAAPAVARSVLVTADWFDFAASLRITSSLPNTYGNGGATPGEVSEVTRRGAADLAATPVPLGPRGADWSALDTGYNAVTGAAPRAVVGTAPQLQLSCREPLARYARLVAGRFPRLATLRQAARTAQASTGVVRPPLGGTFEVAVTQATAARFGLHPGSRVAVGVQGMAVTLTVTGVLRPVAPGSAFWTADPVAAAPFLVPPSPYNTAYWEGTAFAGPAELAAVQALFPGQDMRFEWDFPLALGRLDADQAQALAGNLSRAASRTLLMAGPVRDTARSLNVSTPGPAQVLSAFTVTQDAVESVLSLLIASLAVIGAIVLLLAGRMAADHRREEFALIRARGAALWQLAALALGDCGLATLAGAAAGAALAAALVPGSTPPAGWWLTGLTLLAALASEPAAVVLAHRDIAASEAALRGQEPAARPAARARRWVAEGTLTVAAVGGLIVLRQQGLPVTGGVNAYTAAAPVLIAVPAALLAMRGYPLLLRGAFRLSARRAGITWFIALTRGARARTVAALPVFALVLALVLVMFAGMIRAAVSRGETAASWQATGADAVVSSGTLGGGLSPAAQASIAAVPGVTRAAAARITTTALPGGATAAVAAVDPASYAGFVASTPWPRFPLAALTQPPGTGPAGPVPVLASPAVLAAVGRGPVVISSGGGPVTVRIAGTLASTPALPASTRFIVMPLAALRGPGGPLQPNDMLLAGPHLAGRGLAAVVRRVAPGAAVRLRSAALAALADAPLQRGSYALFAVGLGAATGLGLGTLVLSLVLGARAREQTLTRLATMGLSTGQARLAAIGEALPAVLAAIVVGAACAAVLPPLIGPDLDLSVFTGSAAAVPVRASAAGLVVPAAGLAVLGLVTLAAEVTAARRRGLAGALRIGG